MGFWIFGKKKKKENEQVESKEVVKTKKDVPAKGENVEKAKVNTTEEQVSKPAEDKVEEPIKAPRTITKKVYHVSLRKDDGKWQVKYGGGKKAIKLFDTQAEAIKFAEERADSQEGSISIHKKDGKIRKQDYSKKAEDSSSK